MGFLLRRTSCCLHEAPHATGVVNAADFSAMNSAGTTWATGDFNYDGTVNADDYAMFALGLSESGGENISATLPEPAGTLFSFVLGAALLRRRRQGNF